MILAPCTLTRIQLLARLVHCGLTRDAAAGVIEAAEEQGIVEWVGMSADGEPVYALRQSIYITSPGRPHA